jgi:hypothetical protein
MEIARKPNWFLWGMIFAVIPSIPFVFIIRELISQKQTGLGAVAGGAGEAYALLGMLFSVVLPAAAIFTLFRSLSRSNMGRSAIASVAIGWSTLLLLYYGGMVFVIYRFQR